MNTNLTPNPTTSETRNASVLAHLAGPASSLISAGWLAVVGPLVVWFIYRDKSPFVRAQAAESFNFQVTMWLAAVLGGLLCLTIILIPLGVVMILGAMILSILMGVIAAVKVANGESYSYPWHLSFLR